MAKQRYISTSIWDDDWFVEELNKGEKLFYFYLLTNEHTNIAGIYKISIRKISQESSFSKTEINTILKKFEYDKKVYYRQEHMIMPNWLKHQKWQKSTQIHKGIRAILIKDIPNSVLETITATPIPYLYPIDTLSKGIQYVDIPYEYPPILKDLDLDLDSDLDLDLDNNKAKPPVFKKPTIEEIREFCKSGNKMDLTHFDIETFFDHYTSNGWKIGKVSMKDWKATIRNWVRRDKKKPSNGGLRERSQIPILTNCPACNSENLIQTVDMTSCKDCKKSFELVNGVWV